MYVPGECNATPSNKLFPKIVVLILVRWIKFLILQSIIFPTLMPIKKMDVAHSFARSGNWRSELSMVVILAHLCHLTQKRLSKRVCSFAFELNGYFSALLKKRVKPSFHTHEPKQDASLYKTRHEDSRLVFILIMLRFCCFLQGILLLYELSGQL